MSVIIGTTSPLAVQMVPGIIVCKACKIGFPSERSSRAHLSEKHEIDAVNAKTLATNAALLAQAASVEPHILREAYLSAPQLVSGSAYGGNNFYPPLAGLEITTGFRCAFCPSCYSSEKGLRRHLSDKHHDDHLSVDDQWNQCEQSGTIQIQTLYSGAKTSYFPVSDVPPLGELRISMSPFPDDHTMLDDAPQSPTSSPRQDTPEDAADKILQSNGNVKEIFAEMDEAFSTSPEIHVMPSHMNAFLARTKFDVQLQNEGISMATAVAYSGLLDDRTPRETLVVQDVSKYLLNVPKLIPNIAPSVLHDINLRGDKEFTVVSTRAAERYARHFARIVISSIRVQDKGLLSNTVTLPLKAYLQALSNPSSVQVNRNDLLHDLLKTICLHRLDKMDSPKPLFVRQFIAFAAVRTMSRSQLDSFRFVDASDISPLLAALLYGASSCALTEIHKLGSHSQSLRDDPFIDPEEAKLSRALLNDRLEDILSSIEESQNSAASFIRKTLTTANSIVRKEDVDFVFDICQSHSLCGIVDNVHIKMTSLGDIVKDLHRDIRSSFSSLLYGASLPDEFYSHLAAFQDVIQDKSAGFSFLSHGTNKTECRNYAVWLFNQITQICPTGKADFSPSQATPPAEVVQVFGKTLRRKAIQNWLANIQCLQDMLLACTHLSSGSPGRATELETLKLFNTEYALRNVYISQGSLVVVTRYSKTRTLTGYDKVIPRFPDQETSKLFLTYLVLFRSLESIFLRALYDVKVMKTHMQGLFVERGATYPAPRIRDVIRRLLHARSLYINFNHFRHFAAGMVPIITQNSPSLLREELITEAHLIAHSQAGHSLQVAEHVYARRPTDIPSLPTTALARYRLFSTEWHRSMGLLPHTPTLHPIPQPVHPTSSPSFEALSLSLAKSISRKVSRKLKHDLQTFSSSHPNKKRLLSPNEPSSSARRPSGDRLRLPPQRTVQQDLSQLLPSLRSLLKTPNAMFTSDTQLRVATAVCDARDDLMVLMPTGSGKTVSFLLPVFLEGSECSTVIIVPLAALVHEHVQTCRKLGISVATWSDRHEDVQVYVISIDHTLGQLQSFLNRLQNSSRLRRIVIDEAHLLILWSSFRASIRRLPYVLKSRGHYVQVILLTATLPPYHREKLLNVLGLPSVVLYSQPTSRSNLRFSVIDTSPSSDTEQFVPHEKLMTDTLCEKVFQLSTSLLENDGGRILIFTLYKREAERLQSALQQFLSEKLRQNVPIHSYHAGLPSSTLKQIFDFWKATDAKLKIITATEAFASGIHVDNLDAVLHYGGSNGLLQYAQEAGRAGRGGKPAQCTIIYNKIYAERHTSLILRDQDPISFSTEDDLEDRKQEWLMMQAYMTQTTLCRKNQLFAHIDGNGPGMCIFDQNSINCDICDQYENSNGLEHTRLISQPSDEFISPSNMFLSPTPQPTLPPISSQPQQPSRPSGSSSSAPPYSSPNGPLPVTRRLTFSQSQDQFVVVSNPDNILNDFRSACHSLQNICVACLVINSNEEMKDHRCKDMRNRCKRCFQLGHQVSDCRAFNPRRTNYCYRCSLSQIKGENIHRAQEFGKNCFMGIARDVAWAFWNKDSVSRENLAGSLFRNIELEKLQRCSIHDDVGNDSNEFFDTWLRTEWDGVSNLVRFFLWWFNVIKST